QVEHHAALHGFHANAAFGGQASLAHEAGKAARTVAAVFHLAAIAVENAIAEVHVRLVGCFHHKNLVAANAEVAIGNQAQPFRAELHRLGQPVDHDKVIAKPVHLGESQTHAANCLFPWGSAYQSRNRDSPRTRSSKFSRSRTTWK